MGITGEGEGQTIRYYFGVGIWLILFNILLGGERAGNKFKGGGNVDGL